MQQPVQEARALSKVISCTTAGTHVLYTCPSNCRAKVPLLFFSNLNGNNSVGVQWYRKADNYSYGILGGKNLSQGEFVQFSNGYIVLEPGDRLEVTLSTSGNIDALCTAEEMFSANIVRA